MATMKSELVLLIKKHPKTASRTLARMYHKDHPERNLENIRATIRRIRGAFGKDTQSIPELEAAWKSLDVVEFKYEEIEDFKLTGVKKLGVVADIHFPLHDKKAVNVALDRIISDGCDGLLLNGDCMDCFSTS